MAIELYVHNQEACRAVQTLLERENRAAVVHPTGTGKSMIAFRLAQMHPQQRFLWLSPSEYIVQTQLENVRKADETADFSHIQFMTYARLMLLGPGELAALQPDYIILDEFHRCGAEMWGAGIERLLSMYEHARLIGLSATKIRYLDHHRDMVEELFDGHIASEMSLGEAVVRGILPAPKYVTTIYQYQKSLEKYAQRIQSIRSKRQRGKSEKYLLALRRAMEKADGLEQVFQRHLTDKTGRYIVFCANVAHMKEMHAQVGVWFSGIDPQPRCYFVYADSAESSEAYEAFRRDNSDHLKLLFCVNMLNEGVHVEGISGVILFRPTISPIIYKQQIGRALTAGKTAQPLILDVVNNIESLYSISSIEQEMEEAATRLRASGRGNLIVHERFKVIDQVEDCRRLFGQLEESLHIDWEEYFLAAKEYRDARGDLLIPQRYVTDDGKCLGAWLNTQRCIYNGTKPGKLTQAQIDKLNDLGMIWDNVVDSVWEEHFEQAVRYAQRHGNIDVPAAYVDDSGFALGKWIARMRLKRKRMDTLTEKERTQLQQLDRLGMIWDCWDHQWETCFAYARQYFEAYGNLMVPSGYKAEDGFALGQWIFNLRAIRRGVIANRQLTAEQIIRLDQIGMFWGDVKDERWMEWYSVAQEYYNANGNLAVRKDFVTPDGRALGVWLVNQRAVRRKTEGTPKAMPKERIRLLDELGMRW